MPDVNERQVGGEHYKSSWQHWDLMASLYGAAHFEIAITKYVMRWRKKDGLKDIQKAVHYWEKLNSLYESGRVQMRQQRRFPDADLKRFFEANDIEEDERRIILAITSYSNNEEFLSILPMLKDLERRAAN